MRVSLDYAALEEPAAARKSTFLRRVIHNAGCAIGLSLITGSYIPLLLNYPLLVGMLALDVRAGQWFLSAPAEKKAKAAVVFMAMSVIAISTYAAMALVGALLGGADGRLAAMFMAAGSLVTIIVLMVEAPFYMILSAAPCALLLTLLPVLPSNAPAQGSLAAAIGLYLTAAVFAHQLYRAARHHVHLSIRNKASREEAVRRGEEAEARRIEAETRRQEAENASRVKGEFLAMMTHELRTPLNSVINYAEIIEEEGEPAIADDAKRITRSAHHLLSLIDRILDYAALQDGRINLDAAPLDLVEMGRAALDAQQEFMRKNNNRGAVICAEASAPAHADRGRVWQCMLELVSNAARFTANGEVTIEIKRAGADWRVIVSDTGVGMCSAQLEKAFQPFAQADGALTRSADGLGLGLAGARMAARLMQGDMDGESTPGAGTRIVWTLPAGAPAGLRAA